MVRYFQHDSALHSFETPPEIRCIWLDIIPVLELLPSPLEHASILSLSEDLKKFESVLKGLQRANSKLFEARTGCDWLIAKFPITSPKLSTDFCDPRNRAFESAVTKIQGNAEHHLTVEESTPLIPLLKNQNSVVQVEEDDDDDEDFDAALKRARLIAPAPQGSRYVNLTYILAATNIVKRLFSMTRKLWTEDRKKMTPATLEMIMFLKINRDLWNQNQVHTIRRDPRPRPELPVPAAQERANAEDVAAIAVANIEDLILQLDNPETGEFQNTFLNAGEDGDFRDKDNIAAFLGNLRVRILIS